MLRVQAQHWDILPLQSSQGVFWTLVEWEPRKGCTGGTGAVHKWGNSHCHLLSFSGSGLFKRPLTRLMATHSPSRSRSMPRHHGTVIQINPRTCAESTVGVCFFCDWAKGGRQGWRRGREMESCTDKCVKRTLASLSLLLSEAAETEWLNPCEGEYKQFIPSSKQSHFSNLNKLCCFQQVYIKKSRAERQHDGHRE